MRPMPSDRGGPSGRSAGDEVIGATASTAARVIGVAEHRLRRWNTIGLVLPSISECGPRRYWTYALDDLVQGRVVRALEDRGQDVRVIRRVVEAVRSTDHPRPLAQLLWAVAGRDVFVGFPDGQWVGGRRPTQGVVPDVLDLEQIRVEARAALKRPGDVAGQTEQKRGRLGSKEVFAGTRVPVAAVVLYLDRGLSDTDILEAFPDLTINDIDAVRRRAS